MKYFKIIALCLVFYSVIFSQDNSPTLFLPDKIVEDIDFLIGSLNNIHPTFHEYLSDDSYKAKIDSIKESLQQPLTKHEFFKVMQPLIAIDSHTSLRFDGKIYPEVEAPLFPFKVIIHNNQMYVEENLSTNTEIKKGMIIESINGLPTHEIIDQFISALDNNYITQQEYDEGRKMISKAITILNGYINYLDKAKSNYKNKRSNSINEDQTPYYEQQITNNE